MPHRNIFRRILFCTDFSQTSDKAFTYALNIAEGNPDCELVILHVIPEPSAQFWKSYIYEVDEIDSKAKHDIDEKIARAYVARIPPTVSWTTRYAIGKVSEQIVGTAREERADLVIVGRQGRSRLGRLFFGSVIEHLARKIRVPVLIVPREEG